MERTDKTRLYATSHPSVEVRKAGFPLDHRHLERCWTPLLSLPSVVSLRRIPQLWCSTDRGGPLLRTFERISRFRFAESCGPGELTVFTEIPPVRDRQPERLSAWHRRRHEELLEMHLDHLATGHRQPPNPSDVSVHLDAMTASRSRNLSVHDEADRPRPTTAGHPSRPIRHPADGLSPTYPFNAANAVRPHPSSKHTLAAFPPGKLRPARLRTESVR